MLLALVLNGKPAIRHFFRVRQSSVEAESRSWNSVDSARAISGGNKGKPIYWTLLTVNPWIILFWNYLFQTTCQVSTLAPGFGCRSSVGTGPAVRRRWHSRSWHERASLEPPNAIPTSKATSRNQSGFELHIAALRTSYCCPKFRKVRVFFLTYSR